MDKLRQDAIEMLEKAFLWNEMQFKDVGEVGPTVLIKKDDKVLVIPLSWKDDKEKYRMTKAMNYALLKMMPEVGVFTSESWVVATAPSDYPLLVQPSQHPDRKEAVMMLAQWKGGAIMRYYPILESAGVRYIGERLNGTLAEDESGSGDYGVVKAQMFDGVFDFPVGAV